MWPSPQGWWVKERGEVRDWGQAHWSASFFQRHPTTRSNMLQDIRKCGKMTRRCCWLERLCSSASPPPLKPGYKRQESAADDEEGKRLLSPHSMRRRRAGRERRRNGRLTPANTCWSVGKGRKTLNMHPGQQSTEHRPTLFIEANLPGFLDSGHRVHLLVDRNRWNLLSSILWEGLHHNFTHPCPLNSSWNINLYKNLPTLWPWILTP